MPKIITIRNVPNALHRRLKARAAMSELSLSDVLLAEIGHLADRPSVAELRERLRRRSHISPRISAAAAIRQERDSQ